MRPVSTITWRQLRLQRRHFSCSPRRLDNYAFIGLGQMGFQMAKNLQAKLPPGDNLRIFDINREAAQRLAGEMAASQAGGASVELADSAADASKEAVSLISVCPHGHIPHAAASNDETNDPIYDLSWGQLAGPPVIIHTYKANPLTTGTYNSFFDHLQTDSQESAQELMKWLSQDVTITALPEPSHVKAVYASILGAKPSPRPSPRLFIDCSTIDPSSSQEVAGKVAEAFPGGKAHLVDAPMSGGIVGAAGGTLTFMLGAPTEVVPRIEPILRRMGKNVLHCGKQGTGLSAKLANNYLLAINNIATAEAMNLGMRWGLDPKVLAGVINVSTGRCWPSEVNNPVKGVVEKAPAGRDYAGGFGISLMRKDLKLAMVAAEEAGARLELAGSARDLYEAAEKDEACKGRDFSVVYRWLGGKE